MEEELRLKEKIKAQLGAQPGDAFFLARSHAEAINHLFLASYLDLFRLSGHNQFLTTPLEEKPTWLSLQRLEQLGCLGKWVSLNSDAVVTPEALEGALRPRTALVSLSWAHASTGIVQPIEELIRVCRKREVLIHLDAHAVFGTRPLAFHETGADFLTFEGGLLVKEGIKLSPLILGEDSRDLETLQALEEKLCQKEERIDHLCTETVRLRNRFEQELQGAVIFFQEQERLPHLSVVAFPSVFGEALLFLLQRKGFLAELATEPLFKLTDPKLAYSSLRFSFSDQTTDTDIDQLLEAIHHSVQKLRTVSGALL